MTPFRRSANSQLDQAGIFRDDDGQSSGAGLLVPEVMPRRAQELAAVRADRDKSSGLGRVSEPSLPIPAPMPVPSPMPIDIETYSHVSPPPESLLASAWHVNGTNPWGIRVQPVWHDYRGRGIAAAVIDSGIDYLHADLAPNYDRNRDYDFVQNDNDPIFTVGLNGYEHGTAVIGVIGADDNGSGAVGVAPDATVFGYKISYDPGSTPSQSAAAFRAAVNVDVANSSWGYNPFVDDFRSALFLESGLAIRDAAANGRGGRGTNLVFAAGNGQLEENVNMSNHQNSIYTTAVGAIGSNGRLTNFTTFGSAVHVVAPGDAIVTTDITGAAGYSSGDTASVRGTSFSAPVVSGVIALMLEANPNLGYRDVQEILAYSARLTNDASSIWRINNAHNWNGGGLHTSFQAGFGLVNAHDAVRLAETWRTGAGTYATMDIASASGSPNLFIPDNRPGGVTASLAIGRQMRVDKVTVEVDITHTWRGDLKLTLISPGGTESVLLDGTILETDSSDNINFVLTSNQFWGEESSGVWRLRVEDLVGADVGTLRTWNLKVHGDDAIADDVYVFTDEYAIYGAQSSSRRTLADAAGLDTLNASALTAGATIDLSRTRTSIIAGTALNFSAGTVIENLIGGDGGDSLYGNSAANRIDGGRGNDSIFGGEGDDTLVGGVGADLLDGEAGNDSADYSSASSSLYVRYLSDGSATATLAGETDTLISIERVLGGAGADFLLGGTSGVTFVGGAGNDILSAGSGGGTFYGGLGDDLLAGQNGADTFCGGAGNDAIYGAGGIDLVDYSYATSNLRIYLSTGATSQVTVSATDIDTLNGIECAIGGSGNDIILAQESTGTIWGGAGNDILNTGYLGGSAAYGGDGDDVIAGQSGDDLLSGGLGNDLILGSAGSDTVDYSYATTGFTLAVVQTAFVTIAAGDVDMLNEFENIIGGSGNDWLIGDSIANSLWGGDGADTLDGGAGNDLLVGGRGNDHYKMGRGYGRDTIDNAAPAGAGVYDRLSFGADIAHDQIWFQRSGNDLIGSIIGTNDSVLLLGWYVDPHSHVDQLIAGNGRRLEEANMQILVDAMSAFSPPPLGATTLNAATRAALAPVLAAVWQ
jgi:subtilisin-like proprotein convertase family protein